MKGDRHISDSETSSAALEVIEKAIEDGALEDIIDSVAREYYARAYPKEYEKPCDMDDYEYDYENVNDSVSTEVYNILEAARNNAHWRKYCEDEKIKKIKK